MKILNYGKTNVNIKTGNSVEKSGVYKCFHEDSFSEDTCGEEMTFVKGNRVPPCPVCGNSYFISIHLARHVSEI